MADGPLLRLPFNIRQRLGAFADTPDALQGLNDSIAALQSTSPVFLQGFYPIADLPSPADNVGKYARVTDLWGDNTRDVLLAASSVVGGVTTPYWMPLRPVHAQSQAAATMTLTPLVNAQVQFLTGAIAAGVTRQVDLAVARAWPGAMFEVAFDGTLGLGGGLNIAGTGLGSLVGMLAGARKRFVFDQGAWKQF